MYKWEREKPLEEDTTLPRRRRTPSFSSSLLDAIYRSIDESSKPDLEEQEQEAKTMKKKQSKFKEVKDINNLRRAIMIESWVEKQSVIQSSTLSNSASSSSESIWSSSETDSSLKRGLKTKKKADNLENKQAPNPRVFSKTKLRAMKIYGELKKVKQPISPGGRIATFLNSIFNSGNVKKAKMCYVGAVEDVNSEHVSKAICSSSASTTTTTTFSRSCLSKPQSSSRGTTSNTTKHGNTKRSVRFYPVSVILGEDSKPCGHKCVYEDDPSLMPLSTIRTFVKTSSSASSLKENPRKEKTSFCYNNGEADDEEEDDDDEDDDCESYSSSDLFELDHLVGIGRYREELPVYETTNLKTNEAIAKGLIL